MSEIWRIIPDTADLYAASSEGRIRRETSGRILRQVDNARGYLCVYPCVKGKERKLPVHVGVAVAFHGPRPNGMDINHKDGNKQNNRADNLEYASPAENARHAVAHIRKRVVPRSKLTPERVREIRQSNEPAMILAARLAVSARAIYEVRAGTTWLKLANEHVLT